MLSCNPIGQPAAHLQWKKAPKNSMECRQNDSTKGLTSDSGKKGFWINPLRRKKRKKIKEDEKEKINPNEPSRLLKIINDSSKESSIEDLDDNEDRPSSSLFSRVNNTLRSSLTRLKITGYNQNNNNNKNLSNNEVRIEDIEPLKLTELEKSAGSSTDSGLGEDSSDLETSRTDNTTSTAGNSSRTNPTPILTSSLRKVSSMSRRSTDSDSSMTTATTAHNTKNIKKHVVIREPSLSTLPSTFRRQQTVKNTCRVVTTRIYSAPARLPSIKTTGTVSSVWSGLYQNAYDEVITRLQVTESKAFISVGLIFSSHSADLSSSSSDDIGDLIHSVYKILYIPWIELKSPHLQLVIHIIQRFMVVLIDYVEDLNDIERKKFSVKFRDLLRTSEMTCYQNLNHILNRTRFLYIEFWCALLTVPFNEPHLMQEKLKLAD